MSNNRNKKQKIKLVMFMILRKVKLSNVQNNLFFKKLFCNLIVLLIVNLVFFGLRLGFTDKVLIYIENNHSDFLQVFFLNNSGIYTEENSQRSSKLKNESIVASFSLPLASISHIRIDPTTSAGEIIITKIEIKHLLGKDIYLPEDILTNLESTQMIDSLKVTSGGLLIHSTGSDAALWLRLRKTPFRLELMFQLVVSVFLTFFLVRLDKINLREMLENKQKYILFLFPFLISVGIVVTFFPGAMSYDTLHALRGARNGVTDSMWPPMVSYVWRVVDLISYNPSLMHSFQVSLLVFSIFLVIFLSTRKIFFAIIFLLIYVSIPVVIGTLAVIWKDVLMASFFIASYAVIEIMGFDKIKKWHFTLLSLVTLVFLFLGTCSRHNAIAGAVPLIFYLAFVVCFRLWDKSKKLWIGTILLGSMLTSTLFICKTILDNYSLPSFIKMNSSTEIFLRYVRVLDVAGASICVGESLFSNIAPNVSLSEIKSGYDPRHVNLSKDIFGLIGVDNRIDRVWLNVAIHHPICFLYNKFELTKYMLGINKGAQFLITQTEIEDNEYGYVLPKSSLRDAVFSYIVQASELLIFRPWFLYLLAILSFIYIIRIGRLSVSSLSLFLSATCYFASLVVFGNAADARLPFYTTTALLMFICFVVSDFNNRRR